MMRLLGGTDASGRGISIGIDNGMQGSATADSAYLDATGLTVLPGFIDIQVNGGYGHDFTSDPATIWDVGARLPEAGVTSFCPTIITSPPGTIESAQSAMAARPANYRGADPIGLHIEGPHLSHGKRGTHPAELLTPPSQSRLTPEHIAIVTVAPELAGALALIHELVDQGIVVSVGHSEATAVQTRAALDAGATLGTHLFNAMAPITAREPGIAGVLLADRRAYFGVIADGIHLDAAALTFAWNAAPNRCILVTDAIAAMGMEDGTYQLGTLDVVVEAGEVRNAEGALAGSVLTMDRALSILIETTAADLASAAKAASFNPSEALGRWDLGRLRRGARADLTLLDGTRVAATIVSGTIAYLRDADRWIGPPGTVG